MVGLALAQEARLWQTTAWKQASCCLCLFTIRLFCKSSTSSLLFGRTSVCVTFFLVSSGQKLGELVVGSHPMPPRMATTPTKCILPSIPLCLRSHERVRSHHHQRLGTGTVLQSQNWQHADATNFRNFFRRVLEPKEEIRAPLANSGVSSCDNARHTSGKRCRLFLRLFLGASLCFAFILYTSFSPIFFNFFNFFPLFMLTLYFTFSVRLLPAIMLSAFIMMILWFLKRKKMLL